MMKALLLHLSDIRTRGEDDAVLARGERLVEAVRNTACDLVLCLITSRTLCRPMQA